MAYSILTALESGLFGEVYVSTDDDEIADVAKVYGGEPILRPAGLERDEVGTQAVMQAALTQLQALTPRKAIESACCIYPTAPMLMPQDLLDGYRAMKKRVARYAFSVGYPPLRDAGCYYWGLAQSFINGDPLVTPETVLVPLPDERVCDINLPEDWERAERMFAALRIKEEG